MKTSPPRLADDPRVSVAQVDLDRVAQQQLANERQILADLTVINGDYARRQGTRGQQETDPAVDGAKAILAGAMPSTIKLEDVRARYARLNQLRRPLAEARRMAEKAVEQARKAASDAVAGPVREPIAEAERLMADGVVMMFKGLMKYDELLDPLVREGVTISFPHLDIRGWAGDLAGGPALSWLAEVIEAGAVPPSIIPRDLPEVARTELQAAAARAEADAAARRRRTA